METLFDLKVRHSQERLALMNERINATELLMQQTTEYWKDAVIESKGDKQTIESVIRITASLADFKAIFDKKIEKMEMRHQQELLNLSALDSDHSYS